MKSETMQESLSAVMDGEADELELRRFLQATEQDSALRERWRRYQLARAALHAEACQPRVDLSAGIAAALADEPVVSRPSSARRWMASGLGRAAVAASVTLAVLVGVRMTTLDSSVDTTTPLADVGDAAQEWSPAPVSGVGGSAMLTGFPRPTQGQMDQPQVQSPTAWHEQRIGSYLRQHAEHGAGFNMPHVLPYARAASLEGR
ncbi:sigma-E factor negative regulatory protein [Halopseudomonas salegens]|uniref:Anti sigma-E protein, RseA n=1 Tax=Halopseudomonas salegens TaxID=1434072 RepID=A0A1H2EFD0_9GAMM|nr:RseA family anti-sigma factor [Halopseudomonas salegens]SDT93438.1 anti sigma-E protein, RseA [Halopseudomonas salegens]